MSPEKIGSLTKCSETGVFIMQRMIALKSLLAAMGDALVGAQNGMDWVQLKNIRDYLHGDATPKTMKFLLPDPGAKDGALTEYQAPLLSLVAPQILGIRHAELDFQVGIGDVEFESDDELPPQMSFLDLRRDAPSGSVSYRTPKDILVDTSPQSGKGAPGTLHINLRVRGVEPQDGYTRLLTLLSQQQGANFAPASETPAPEEDEA